MGAKRIAERARLLASARAFLASRGYVEVETPVLVPSPGLDVHLDAFAVSSSRYLATSPEYQMKRLLADGHTRIFQITRAFRADEVGERHNPEFTILELYRAHADAVAVMRDTEQLVARLTGGHVRLGTRVIDVRPPFRRITVSEAFRDLADADALRLAETDEDAFFRTLVDVVEPRLAALDVAVFLTEYPKAQASLARKKPGDPRVAERFELYVAGVELCNGFGELTDPVEQRARFEHDRTERARLGKPVFPIDEKFLSALERGIPDSGGNAIGFDRLVALACGTTSIAEVMAFTDAEL
jgi:lysyl-tRNA synthetase class 2